MDNNTRALVLLKYLKEESNEEHVLSLEDLIGYLIEKGYKKVDRRTIYSDIKALNNLNEKIVYHKRGYYYNGYKFKNVELRLLADAIRDHSFIPVKESEEIIKKLALLTNKYDRNLLASAYMHRKSDNKALLNNIDIIQKAISDNKAIRFNYFTEDINGLKRMRNKDYSALPLELILRRGRYYLLTYSLTDKADRTYRLDRMAIKGYEENSEYAVNRREDINQKVSQAVAMFDGTSRNVTLLCKDEGTIASEILDQFGKDIAVMKCEKPGYFRINVNVSISPTFYSWVFQYYGKIIIEQPADIKCEFVELCQKMSKI